MTPDPAPVPAAAPLQFDQAEFVGVSAATCAVCQQAIAHQYFTANGQTLCLDCQAKLKAHFEADAGTEGLLMAAGLGLGGGLAGAAVWYVVENQLNLSLSLFAILIGYLVGLGVRRGSQDRGGRAYQVLALFLTYSAVCWTQVPGMVNELGLLLAFIRSYQLPLMGGRLGGFTLVMIAIGLWEAWRRTAHHPLVFTGPLTLAPAAGATAPVAPTLDAGP